MREATQRSKSFEGKLEAIDRIAPVLLDAAAPRRGAAPQPVARSYETRIQVRRGRSLEEIRYDGIVLPDSIGHRVSVHEYRGRILIHDEVLDRWYA